MTGIFEPTAALVYGLADSPDKTDPHGQKKKGQNIGKGIGALLGTAVAGPVGGAIGGMAGGLLGGAIGGKHDFDVYANRRAKFDEMQRLHNDFSELKSHYFSSKDDTRL